MYKATFHKGWPEYFDKLENQIKERTVRKIQKILECPQKRHLEGGAKYFVDEVNRMFTLGGREKIIPDAAIGYFIAYELFRRQAESNKLKRRR